MPSNKGGPASSALRVPPTEMSVRNWPLIDEPLRAARLLIFSTAAAALAGGLSHSISMGMLSLAVLWLTLWRVWLPVIFEVSSRGIAQRVLGRTRRVPWRAIARYEAYPRGVALFPDHDTSPLGRMRGWYLAAPRQTQELVQLVHYYLARQGARADSSIQPGGVNVNAK